MKIWVKFNAGFQLCPPDLAKLATPLCYLKMVQWVGTPTNHVIARAGFTLRGALGTLEIFSTSFSQILVKTKKVSPSERGASSRYCAIW